MNNSTFIKIIKNMGKIFILIATIGLQIAGSVILFMKGVSLFITIVYGLLFTSLIVGLLWPRVFTIFGVKQASRQWVWRYIGLLTVVIGLVIYMVTIFYIQDAPVMLAGVGVIALFIALKTWRSKRGESAKAATPLRKRTLRFGLISLVLFALAAIAIPLVEDYRNNLAKEGQKERQQVIAAQDNTGSDSDKVRVYPIQTGSTTVSYGQFYGGLSGWEGFDGYLKTLTSKDTITVPIVAYLIDHPKHGLMLVDAGINWEQAHDHDGYYNHNYMVSRMLTTRDEYQLAAPQDLEVQVQRLGYELNDIKTVFMTHVHDDHAGGLRNVPNAKVVLDKKDWDDDARYPYSFEFAEKHMDFPTFDSGSFMSFPESKDYFGDGSVVLIPTPGHSPGHISVSVQMDGYRAFMTGDTIYTLRHIAVDEVRQIMLGGKSTKEQVQVAYNIQHMLDQEPDTVMLFSHDHTDYHFKHTMPYLADGLLDNEERESLLSYRNSLFGDNWNLKPGNFPYYVKQPGGTANGVVEFH